MPEFTKAILFTVTIISTIVAVYGVTPDFSDYNHAVLRCEADRRTMRLGFPVSDETKHLMEVESFRNTFDVKMYVRIAPKSDPDEVKDAQRDYEETKKKIEEKHPDTISRKAGQPDRRVIGIADVGFGRMTKEGKQSVPCYYFVVEYNDDFSDYAGGTIVCQDVNSSLIELDDGKGEWRFNGKYKHTLKVKTFKGKVAIDTYVRIASLSNFMDVTTTIGDWENTMLEIENSDVNADREDRTELNRRPLSIPSEGEGVLKKNGKDDIDCYYFMIGYRYRQNRKAK